MLATNKTFTHKLLLERLARARAETDKLFALVAADARYARPIRERHRVVFYLGHLEAFDFNLMQRNSAALKSFDPSLDRLFAFGIDPVDSSGLPSDRPSDWPEYSQVQRYASEIRRKLDAILEEELLGEASSTLFLNVAIEHRLMHAETLAYMLHQLPYHQKLHQPQAELPKTQPPDFGLVEIPAGSVILGLSGEDAAFGWDNEYDAHRVDAPAFEIDRYKVTNAQFVKFVEDGGYRHRPFWSDSAWAWKEGQQIQHPVFWTPDESGWQYRGMFEQTPLPPHWPVYVSHAEASAYCAWAGKRLPAEAEWQRACYNDDDRRVFTRAQGYFDFARWDPSPVNAFPSDATQFALRGVIANGWEWTSTHFAPFKGFKPFPFYEGYSANFFDGMHYVLKGGSPRTDQCMLRPSFRNWFQPHYQYVYAGFRCAA